MNNEEENQNEINLETFRLKKLIQNLDQMRGLGTSMITLIINHQDQINHSSEMLNDEIRKWFSYLLWASTNATRWRKNDKNRFRTI